MISLISKNNIESYDEAIKNFEYLWDRTLKLSEDVIKQYNFVLEYAIEKWDMDYINPLTQNIVPNSM